MMKTAVIYFSHTGNSRNIARYIQKRVPCDLYAVLVDHPYAKTCQALTLENGSIEKRYQKDKKSIMETYELLIFCTPIWWYRIAPASINLLKEIDTNGKVLIPFLAHGGYGIGNSSEELHQYCPNAHIPWINIIPFHMKKMAISFQELNQMIKNITYIQKKGVKE